MDPLLRNLIGNFKLAPNATYLFSREGYAVVDDRDLDNPIILAFFDYPENGLEQACVFFASQFNNEPMYWYSRLAAFTVLMSINPPSTRPNIIVIPYCMSRIPFEEAMVAINTFYGLGATVENFDGEELGIQKEVYVFEHGTIERQITLRQVSTLKKVSQWVVTKFINDTPLFAIIENSTRYPTLPDLRTVEDIGEFD